MKSIKERFLKDLFINKNVKHKPQFYKLYYHRIFPCEQEFIAFLSTNSTQEMISYAKTIIDKISFFSSYPLSSFAYSDLLNIEIHKTAKTDYEFVAQDHFVHSVNLYLLGIYLFFNHELFHERLMGFFRLKRRKFSIVETQAQNTIKNFISAWKYFAFSHDIGYVFEKLLDASGESVDAEYNPIFLHFHKLYEYILFELIAKSLSRIILYRSLCLHSNSLLGDVISAYIDDTYQQWNMPISDGGNRFLPSDKLSKLLEAYKSYQLIPNVDSYEGLKNILPILDCKNLIQVIKNADDEIAAINIYRGDNIYDVYIEDSKFRFTNEQLRSLIYIGCEEFPLNEYKCEYYSYDLQEQIDDYIKHCKLELYQDRIIELQQQVEIDCSSYLASITSGEDIGQTSFQIYKYIVEQLSKDDLLHEFLYVWNRDGKEIVNKKLISEFRKEIEEAFKTKLKEKTIPNKFNELIKILCDDDVKKRIIEDTEIYSDDQSSAKQAVHSISKITYMEYLEHLSNIPTMFMVDESGAFLMKCNFFLINEFESTNSEYEALIALYRCELATRLKNSKIINDVVTFNDFLQYHDFYSKYDHGIVSASILTSFYTTYKFILNNIDSFPFLCSSWPNSITNLKKHISCKNDTIILDSIFSILVHNIYPSVYNNLFSHSFAHEINLNPFAYFCAFCDSLQVWDRHQQIDQSTTSLRRTGYYGEQFDIDIINKKIKISGTTKDIESSKDNLTHKLDAFLRDASTFITLSLSET